MAFLNIGQKPQGERRGSGQHGPKRSGADRFAEEQAIMLKWLRKNRPNEYAKAAMAFANGQFGVTEGSEIDRLIELETKLKKIRGIEKPSATSEWAEVAKGVLSGLNITVPMPGAPPMGPQPQAQAPVVYDAQPQIAPPQPQGEPTPPVDPQDEELTNMVRIDPSILIVRTLSTKTPSEAAVWIMAQENPAAKGFRRMLKNTPDDELEDMLDDFKAQAPALVDYIRQHKEWTKQVIALLRQMPQPTSLPPEKRAAL